MALKGTVKIAPPPSDANKYFHSHSGGTVTTTSGANWVSYFPIPSSGGVDNTAPVQETIKITPATGHIKVDKSGATTKDLEEVVNPGIFNANKTGLSITFGGSRTINLGDFNSVKVSVYLTMPSDPDVLEDAYTWASKWVSTKIEKEIKEAQGEL